MRPMRVHPLAVVLLQVAGTGPLAAQTKPAPSLPAPGPPSWDAFLAQQRGDNQAVSFGPMSIDGRWVMVLRPEDAKDTWWLADDTFRRLQSTQEFRVVQLGAAAARDLWAERGWNNDAKWILLDPPAERIKELNGRPTGEQLLAELKGLGFQPRWERREAFLRDHADHGEAWAEATQQNLALVLTRYQQYLKEGRIVREEAAQTTGAAGGMGFGSFFGRSGAMTFATGSDPTGAALADETFSEAAEALGRVVEVPGWTQAPNLFLAAMAFQGMGAGQSPRMRAVASRMAEQLLDALMRDPHDPMLWAQFGGVARAAGLSPLDAFRKAVPVPGQPWPPMPLVNAVMQEFEGREDWEGALAFLREFEVLAADPLLPKEAWRTYTGLRAELEVQKARCLARLGRWNEVGPAIQDVQRWAGARWEGEFTRRLRFAIPELRNSQKDAFQALLDADALPDLPAPAPPPPLRLALVGTPVWKESWDRLRKAGPLQPWSPAELVWDDLGAPAAEALRRKQGWPAEPARYVLLRGDEVLQSGVGCPYPEDLAAKLTSLAPSLYQRLGEIIRRNPDHLAARRARAVLALDRMPNGHLEPQLAEDARLGKLPPEIRNRAWTPNPQLWQWNALKVLPEADRELRSWPTRTSAWKLWMAWARFHPANPSPLSFARTLPVWGSESRWASRLPKEVHATVAEELRTAGRFEEMRAWFQEAWDGLDKRPLPAFRAFGAFRNAILQQRREQGESIAAPLKEALTVLRRTADVKLVDEALREMLGAPDPATDPTAVEGPRPGQRRGQGPGGFGFGGFPGGPGRGRGQ
ncbi:MAG: hypothetical protein U0P81_03100 [Holophagaceae bacterium]